MATPASTVMVPAAVLISLMARMRSMLSTTQGPMGTATGKPGKAALRLHGDARGHCRSAVSSRIRARWREEHHRQHANVLAAMY